MARIVAALIGGVLLGIAVTWAFIESDFGPVPLGAAVREMDNVPQMTAEVAEAHRQERFEELTTIAEIFALPDRYMRSEALYALAGRSSASDVQKLIFEALGIADEYDRAQALNDLFFRLTSLDPRSALALAQSEYFANDSSLERTVWREWARMDLDEALFAAKTQPSRRQQNVAAQGLYSAFGLLGNETAERIEAELGIGPDRLTRGSYIYRLADNSVEEAIAFINGLDSAAARNDYISWLGFYLSMQDTAMAMTYAHLFERPANRDRFTQLVQNNAARENPQLVLDRYMNSSGTIRYSNEFYTAARQLVGTDIESARHYFEQATSRDARRYLGIQIVAQMVRDDPAAALSWARENDTGDGPGEFERAALAQIAYSDPAFALDEALSIENAQDRSRALSSIMENLTRSGHEATVGLLDRFTDPQQREEVAQNLARKWMRDNPEAALEWTLSLDDETSSSIMRRYRAYFVSNNIDLAISALPRLDEENRGRWQKEIMEQIVSQRSVTDAQAFLNQFEGQPEYEAMQTELIHNVAQRDVFAATQLVDQITDAADRDLAHSSMLMRVGQTDPDEAMLWTGHIADEDIRYATIRHIVYNWSERDIEAAARWATSLPPGAARDQVMETISLQRSMRR